MILQKFLRIGKYEWARQRAYRANLVIWMIVIPLIFLVEYSVWTAVFSASGVDVVRGFTRTDLLVYYLLVHIVLLFTNTNVDKRISEQIKDGSLIKQVIKPMHFFWLTFAKHIWVRIFNLFILPSLVILGYLLIPEISVSPINFMLFLASVVLAMLLTFMYIFLFGVNIRISIGGT